LARKILLADDSVTAQNMGRRILTDAGYEVTTVNNGSAALKRIAESKPDLIVLDVYMPGYSGLEVCQRIRESRETARIPVLLTVGKLEPFKPEEVRRVRADAFIIKPFEASELLTALTKLEDKIVPGPQPYKPGRFAKAMSAAEEAAQSEEFGDVDSGWKNRLKIPPPHHKRHDPQPTETVTISEYKIEERVQAGLSKAADTKPGIPSDITPEEISAINAAAAAFQAQDPSSVAKPEAEATGRDAELGPKVNTETASQPADPVSRSEDDTQEIRIAVPPAERGSVPEPEIRAADSEKPQIVESVAAVSEPAGASGAEGRSEEPQKLADLELTAALASLAPADGQAGAAEEAIAVAEQVPVTMAIVAAGQQFSGPRWVAEAVAMGEAESLLNLDQEMQKSFAAFAAADAAQLGAETVQSSASAEGAASATEAGPVPAESSHQEPAAARMEPPTEAIAETKLAPTEDMAPAITANSVPKEEQAYAAAAGANASTESSNPHAVEATLVRQENAPGEAQPRDESELAAAWANWKQIRDSVASPQLTSQIAESASAALHDIRNQEPGAKPEDEPKASPATGEENGTIALIVDSVLAEIKPRLMQEIAKKMGRDKK
jgi:twitching motility two-component system response regulator PilH